MIHDLKPAAHVIEARHLIGPSGGIGCHVGVSFQVMIADRDATTLSRTPPALFATHCARVKDFETRETWGATLSVPDPHRSLPELLP